MAILTHQKQDNNLVKRFLRTICYQNSTGNKPYGNTLNILTAIFETAGHKHLLHLVKLRKLWFEEVDVFLAKNSYPRNISVLSQLTVDNNLIRECLKVNGHTEIMNALKKLNGETFKHLKEIKSKLQKILKRNLSSEELKFLGQKLHFKPYQTILHLTVYDGGIAQALRFETEAYLRMFNRLLPELKLNNIQCHVGDLGQTPFDQQHVGLLAKDWKIITPPEVHLRCSPAFLHRVSRAHAVLVLYVNSKEEMDLLKRTPGADWLLQRLHQKLPEMKDVIQRIGFALKQELDLEQIRLRTVLVGNSIEGPSSIIKDKSFQTESHSYKKSNAKKQFAKIRNMISGN
tara:strand:+ start:115 stop:1146 length:1032 start_codon:yes stop_codon:yes gene_type:complete